jgi:hypothetical protein
VWKASIGEEGHSVTPIVLESSTKMPPQEKAHFYETEILWGPEKKKQSWPRRVLGLSLMNKDTKILNKIFVNWAGRVAEVVEGLPMKHEALNSSPSTTKKILQTDFNNILKYYTP